MTTAILLQGSSFYLIDFSAEKLTNMDCIGERSAAVCVPFGTDGTVIINDVDQGAKILSTQDDYVLGK